MDEFSKTVLTNNLEEGYVIVLGEKGTYDDKGKNNIIYVKSKREIELLLFILKTEVNIYKNSINNTEILNWLEGKSLKEILSELNIHGTEYREFARVIEKIPVTTNIKEKLKESKEKLDKGFVHKRNANNVVLSKEVKIRNSNLIFFKSYADDTDEITLDHIAEDHVEGILLSEMCRQASIASINLCMESSKVFVLLDDNNKYIKFVDRDKDKDIIIKVFSIGETEGPGFCVLNIIQEDNLCVKAIWRGYNYKSKEDYISAK